jgi:HEAT repeat protein
VGSFCIGLVFSGARLLSNVEALKEKDKDVRKAAKEALKKIQQSLSWS